MKPTKDQIDRWIELATADEVSVTSINRVAELAYAAGRQAGLLKARAILASVNNFSNPMTCSDCIDEIDAAMEADK